MPASPISYSASRAGTTVKSSRSPSRSTSTASSRPTEVMIANATCFHCSTGRASMATIRSPGRIPAASPGEPASTVPTSAGIDWSAGTSTPTMKSPATSSTASTPFIAGPAR